MSEQPETLGTCLTALSRACRAFDGWNAKARQGPWSPAACTALAVGLHHHAGQVAMLAGGAARVMETELERMAQLEHSIQGALEGHKTGELDWHSPYSAGPMREMARKSVPFELRRLAMDWLARPYQIDAPELAAPTDQLTTLAERSDRVLGATTRQFTRAMAGDRVDPVRIGALRGELAEVSDDAVRFVADFHQDVMSATWRRQWLEYLEHRLLPGTTEPVPRPGPRAEADPIRKSIRKAVPEKLRHAVRDWALPPDKE
jgi:hypothetical protein